VEPGVQAGSDLALEATRKALERADMDASELDCIIYATLSPDYFFPGSGVFLQRKLGVKGIPALDIRNQCTGFIYGLSVADAWIRTGQYRRILLVGAEVHSTGMDFTPAGRDISVLFGDGAGAVILGPTDDPGPRRPLHPPVRRWRTPRSSGASPMRRPASRASPTRTWMPAGTTRIMEGRDVFKHAVVRMPESSASRWRPTTSPSMTSTSSSPTRPTCASTRWWAASWGSRTSRIYNNIQRFGNTTAATIPIAIDEAVEKGLLEEGDLLVLTAFGSGFTWGSAAIRW
jgi:3-oxoacyl-[acyl-carrier-protein] synthase III